MTPLEELLRAHGPAPVDDADVDAALASVLGRHRRRRWTIGLAIVVGVVGILASGATIALPADEGESVAVEAGSADASTDLDELVGVDWYFTSMTFDDTRPALDLSGEVTELRFDEDGALTADVCNGHAGDWRSIADGVIAVEGVSTTDMGCGGTIGDAQQAMRSLLNDEFRWEVRGEELTLRAPGITASLRTTPSVFPERLTLLERADHPTSAQYAIGYSGEPDGIQTIEILARSEPSQEFTSATVDSDHVLSPAGLTPPGRRTIVAAWLPPDTTKAWVRLTTGGAEINLDLERLSDDRLVGWASLPEPSGVIVAFDAEGNEIDRSATFDF